MGYDVDFIHRESAPIVVHEELKTMNGYTSSRGHFAIDATLGRETSFGIYVDDEEDHLIKSVRFKDTKGTKYGPYTSMSSLYDIINLKTVNFPVGEAPPFDDVRNKLIFEISFILRIIASN